MEDIDAQKFERVKDSMNPILEALTTSLITNRPTNISEYCKNWLIDNQNKYYNLSNNIKKKNKPLGFESSSENEDDCFLDETNYTKSLTKKAGAKVRTSVSAEVFGKFNFKQEFKPIIIEKTEELKQKIHDILDNCFMFKNLENEEKEVLINTMSIKDFKKGDQVIKQGDDGYELYIIESGKLKCTKNDKENNTEVFLKNYEKYDCFGELSLLYNTPRAANIYAETDCTLIILNRDTFNNIVKDAAVKKREKFENFLMNVEVLQELDNYEKMKLCDCLTVETFKKDEIIIKEGEKGDKFYLIIEGTAEAYKHNNDTDKENIVYKYKENDYFGELALLRNCKRAATVKTVSDVKVAYIDRNAFKRILGPLEEFLERNSEKYSKYLN